MKFAVTGGFGFIGSNIVKLLIQKGHDVEIIDKQVSKKKTVFEKFQEKVNFNQTDICDPESLRPILNDVDGIFHQAALTSVPESYKKPELYHNVNVIGTKNIFEIAQENNLKVVYASSSSVYGNTEKIPIKENSNRNPINPYGKTKLEDEFLAEKFSNNNTRIIGLRYFNVFGKGQTGDYAGVITKFLECINQKKPLKIFGKGDQIRDFIHVNDVAKANIVAMQSKIDQGFFNIGTGKTVSIKQLAELMIEISGYTQGIDYLDALEGDVRASQADMTLTKELLNWNYSIELKDGLSELIKTSC